MRRSLTPLLIEFLNYRLALPASSVLHHTLVQGKTFVHLGTATQNPRFHPFEKDSIAIPFIRAVICFFFYTIRTFLTNPQEMRARTTTVHRFVWYFSLPLYDVHSSCYASFSRVKYLWVGYGTCLTIYPLTLLVPTVHGGRLKVVF